MIICPTDHAMEIVVILHIGLLTNKIHWHVFVVVVVFYYESHEKLVYKISRILRKNNLFNPDLRCHSFTSIGDNCKVCVASIDDEQNSE